MKPSVVQMALWKDWDDQTCEGTVSVDWRRGAGDREEPRAFEFSVRHGGGERRAVVRILDSKQFRPRREDERADVRRARGRGGVERREFGRFGRFIRRVPEQDLDGLEVPPGAGQIKRRLMRRVHSQAFEARVEVVPRAQRTSTRRGASTTTAGATCRSVAPRSRSTASARRSSR